MGTVLVTGAFGLVGSAVVRQLVADGRSVAATDLDIPANRKAAAELPKSVQLRYADLTDPAAVDELLSAVTPAAIIHLAAVIPPLIYQRRKLAYQVNVEATGHLLAAAAGQPDPPRFVQASSIAVYGSRNPHTVSGVLTADTPTNPADVYGDHKVQAEQLVRTSGLDWVILRLGGVLTVDPGPYIKLDNLYFEQLLPADGRLQTVDVRDVASAFVAATTAPVLGETLLIGGDDTHRRLQGDVAPAMAAAMGLVNGLPAGLPGNPDSDDDWFNTDWMDSSRAQDALGFQHHSWPQMLAETAAQAGAKRYLLAMIAPLARVVLRWRAPYYRSGKKFADPWRAIADKWDEPRP
ncbi:NAD(P)-dependent oxidoreductase [Mycolicibacter terrae]|uniref:Oxidoreductase n=2 Tax=Mycolicibacter TaxID=1073531 RepID=A0A1A2XN02_MYCSD|nr:MULTISPECIES: NAD(P)-dependent oxidoreductase [Mycolicibacter]OBH21430.1 oxidoreductase [Mycolicibacter sinensis]OBI26271.1 oxidoreductase [Mycolicibacter sinensis]RRR47288.1 NAD(P)-dependent oxidoreductase [Mycolicibacter terrae]